jgi:hypothetical protein
MKSSPVAQAKKSWSVYEEPRIGMTVSCRDADPIPKAVGIERDGVTPYELQDILFRLENWKHAEGNSA